MTNEKFTGGNWRVSVIGLDLIFAVLCLIARIMIYRLPVRDSIDKSRVEHFKLDLEEIER